jgi:hypothetical protein
MTVGYGDMYPNTDEGRFVVVFVSLGGLFLTATLVGIVNNEMELSFSEKNIITLLHNYQSMDKLKVVAADVIGLTWRIKKS